MFGLRPRIFVVHRPVGVLVGRTRLGSQPGLGTVPSVRLLSCEDCQDFTFDAGHTGCCRFARSGIVNRLALRSVRGAERFHLAGSDVRNRGSGAHGISCCCGGCGECGGDGVDGGAVVRGADEPCLEGRWWQVDAAVEHGVEERRVGGGGLASRSVVVGDRAVGEQGGARGTAARPRRAGSPR